MFPGMNPREMHKAMKRLGIKQEEIDAQEVIIRTPHKDLIIKSPQVSRINMMGQESIQVVGDIEEIEKGTEEEQKADDLSISEEDIATVMQQTNCTKEVALKALQDSNGNLAEAILNLQK